MFRNEDVYYRETIRIWFILAFQAGAINVGGFLACHRFVTHVTGFPTLLASELAAGNHTAAFNIMLVPLFFVLGSMFSAFFVDRRMENNLAPKYSLVFACICFLISSVILFGQLGYFGKFGEALSLRRDYILMGILCAASGIQNAVVTTASGYRVRTTHLTGITTDLGIGIIKLITHRKHKEEFARELRINYYRVGTIAAFTAGGILGAYAMYSYAYIGFLIPLTTAIFLWRDAAIRQRRRFEAQSPN
jgi:uncharacterized membrane protein YoaK (UPF0700 family)